MSLRFDDWRHLILAIQNALAGQIYAQPDYEVARGRRQPVGSMARRSGVLDVNIDRAIGVRYESGTIAYAVPIDRIRHKVIPRIAHGERPECIVRRELSCRKVHDVAVLARELLAHTIFVRRPVHRLLRHVYRSREFIGTGSAQENAIAGLAASVYGGPAVDLRDIGVRDDLERDERQHATNDDTLHDVRDDVSLE